MARAIGAVWLINLIWFRPFSTAQFYDREFIKLALRRPETVTLLGVPVLYDLTKDEWDDVSDARLRSDFQQTKDTVDGASIVVENGVVIGSYPSISSIVT